MKVLAGRLENGATFWDYRIRRMEIAWELAQMRMSHPSSGLIGGNDEQYKNKATLCLKNAWEIVDQTIPDASKREG